MAKTVDLSVPSVGSTSGVAAAQSAAHATRSPASTVPVSVMPVLMPVLMMEGEMAVILLVDVTAEKETLAEREDPYTLFPFVN